MTPDSDGVLEAALAYAARGWRVLSLFGVGPDGRCTCGDEAKHKDGKYSPGKHPISWLVPNGVFDATNDPEKVRAWWRAHPLANVGIALGAASGLAVIDLDGSGDAASMKALVIANAPLPTTARVRSGRGEHIYFALAPGVVAKGGNIDDTSVQIRANGQYVVMPPSRHVNGRRYEWLRHPDEGIAEAPAWLLALVSKDGAGDDPAMAGGKLEPGDLPFEPTADESVLRDLLSGTVPTDDRSGQGIFRLACEIWRAADRRGLALDPEVVAAILKQADAKGWRKYTGRRDGDKQYRRSAAKARRDVDPDAHVSSPLTDSGNAELFAHLYGDWLRFDHARSRWLSWGPHRWKPDPDGEVVRLAKDAARHRYTAAWAINDRAARKAAATWAIASESRSRIDATLTLARAERPIADSGEGWDSDPLLVGVENGVMVLETGRLRDGRQEDRMTKTTGIIYDPAADCPRWIQFLEEVFDDDDALIEFIRRAVSYSLTGLTREQVLFLCHGKGSNGKSVFLNTIRRLAGDYGDNVAFTTLEMNARGNIPADVAAMAGKRLITSSETNEGTRLNAGRAKALTGSDAVTARFMRENFFTFTPTAKIWLAVNHLPRIDDESDGMWRRIRLIPFRRQFSGPDQDARLEDKLKAELPGILAWAIEGAREWLRDGLNPPAVVMAATSAYRVASDPLAEFFADRCIIDPGVKVGAAAIFSAYTGWGMEQGFGEKERLSATTFGRRMGERFVARKGNQGKLYLGIGLKPVLASDGVTGVTALSDQPPRRETVPGGQPGVAVTPVTPVTGESRGGDPRDGVGQANPRLSDFDFTGAPPRQPTPEPELDLTTELERIGREVLRE